jgi:YD repeat-containing protein
MGAMTETIEQNGDPVNDQYNAQGLVTRESCADKTSDAFSYDARGNLLTATTYDATGTLTGTTAMTYNAANELLSIAYPDGKYLDFTSMPPATKPPAATMPRGN